MKILRQAAVAVVGLILATSANAIVIVWDFDLPATGLPSVRPDYTSMGTLTLEDIVFGDFDTPGVKFTLDPNEANTGYEAGTKITGVDYVYAGDPLSADPLCIMETGAEIKSCEYEVGGNLDAGYSVEDDRIAITYQTSAADAFYVGLTSMWVIADTSVADFLNTFATANNKVSPITAVLSVPRYNCEDQPTPCTSNWVVGFTQRTPVPEPTTIGLLGLGLLGMGLTRRRRKA